MGIAALGNHRLLGPYPQLNWASSSEMIEGSPQTIAAAHEKYEQMPSATCGRGCPVKFQFRLDQNDVVRQAQVLVKYETILANHLLLHRTTEKRRPIMLVLP